MRTILSRRVVIGFGLVLGASLGTAAAQPERETSPLPDARLERKARGVQVGGTVAKYLELLTDATEVEHEAAAPFGERPLLALQVEMTLGRIQRLMARNYQLTWKASSGTNPTYRLYESTSNRRARTQALEGMRLRGRAEMTTRLQQIRQLGSLGPEALAQLEATDPGMARSLKHPRGAATHRLVFGLPEPIWAQFWSTGTARVRVSELSPELQALAKEAAGNGRAGAVGGELYQIADLVVPEGRIKLQLGGTLERPTIWSSMQYGPHGMQTNLLYAEAATRQPPEGRRKRALANPSKPPADPRFKQKITLKDRPRPGNVYLESGERPPNAHPLAELLQQLEKQVDLPILAECDHKPKDANWLRQQWWLAKDIEERPLSEALDLLCADFEFEWQYWQGALLLRPKRWFVPPEQQGYVYPKLDPPARKDAAP